MGTYSKSRASPFSWKRVVENQRKSSYFSLLLFALLLGGIYYVFAWPTWKTKSWTPPAGAALTIVHGQFEHQVICSHNNCSAPFTLIADTGDRIALNCEPAPAINDCLYDKSMREGNFLTNAPVANRPAEVDYFRDRGSERLDGKGPAYNIMISVRIDGKPIFTYADRLRAIRDSEVLIGKDGPATRSKGSVMFIFMNIVMALVFTALVAAPLYGKLTYRPEKIRV